MQIYSWVSLKMNKDIFNCPFKTRSSRARENIAVCFYCFKIFSLAFEQETFQVVSQLALVQNIFAKFRRVLILRLGRFCVYSSKIFSQARKKLAEIQKTNIFMSTLMAFISEYNNRWWGPDINCGAISA